MIQKKNPMDKPIGSFTLLNNAALQVTCEKTLGLITRLILSLEKPITPTPSFQTLIQALWQDSTMTYGHPLFSWMGLSVFQKKVYEALLKVPKGQVLTYREMAAQIGMPGAARAVGHAMATNPFPLVIPCHRIVRSDGTLGHYTPDPKIKRLLLETEGVIFTF